MGFVSPSVVNLMRALRNLWRWLARRPPEYVLVEVTGPLPELHERVRILRRFLPGARSTVSLETLRCRLAVLAGDGRVRGVVITVRGLSAGWAALEELRNELVTFRAAGKRVVAYLEDGGMGDYYLGSAADELLMPPSSTLGIVGLSSRVNYLREALEKLGVSAEVLAVSPYKTAGDSLVRTGPSPEAREQLQRLLDGRFDRFVEAVSEGREISPEEAKDRIDSAPYSASEAEHFGLIDGVCYEDELEQRLESRPVDWAKASRALQLPYLGRRRVGVVSVEGTIVRGESRQIPFPIPFLGGRQAGSEAVKRALQSAAANRRVGAILLHVNSGGGDSVASDLIWREVGLAAEKKPVVALMGEAAASGGYYVCAGASQIVARRATLTGSIGVLLVRPVLSGAYEKAGVNPFVVERGARAGLFEASRPPSEEDLKALRSQLDTVYEQFKARVREGRNLGEELERLAGGRVWSGEEASGHGLVDGLGGFREAYEKACELGGVPVDYRRPLMRIAPSGKGERTSSPALGYIWATSPWRLEENVSAHMFVDRELD